MERGEEEREREREEGRGGDRKKVFSLPPANSFPPKLFKLSLYLSSDPVKLLLISDKTISSNW